jgi:hypothetical protein
MLDIVYRIQAAPSPKKRKATDRGTDAAYLHSIAAYMPFHGLRHPRELGLEHTGAFIPFRFGG